MNCPTCKTREMTMTLGAYQYRESGLENVLLDDCPILKCECGTQMANFNRANFKNLESLTRLISKELICGRGRLDGNSIRFLRKAMGLKAVELAEIMRVDRVSVSRWENEKASIDFSGDFRLRLEAADRILSPRERRSIREKITRVLQHSYDTEKSVADAPIRVSAVSVPTAEAENVPELASA